MFKRIWTNRQQQTYWWHTSCSRNITYIKLLTWKTIMLAVCGPQLMHIIINSTTRGWSEKRQSFRHIYMEMPAPLGTRVGGQNFTYIQVRFMPWPVEPSCNMREPQHKEMVQNSPGWRFFVCLCAFSYTTRGFSKFVVGYFIDDWQESWLLSIYALGLPLKPPVHDTRPRWPESSENNPHKETLSFVRVLKLYQQELMHNEWKQKPAARG